MSGRSSPRPRGVRRVERWAVGVVMVIVAIVLERIVKRTVARASKPEEDEPTTFTSKGGEVDLPDL
jgi:hypothetical protein